MYTLSRKTRRGERGRGGEVSVGRTLDMPYMTCTSPASTTPRKSMESTLVNPTCASSTR